LAKKEKRKSIEDRVQKEIDDEYEKGYEEKTPSPVLIEKNKPKQRIKKMKQAPIREEPYDPEPAQEPEQFELEPEQFKPEAELINYLSRIPMPRAPVKKNKKHKDNDHHQGKTCPINNHPSNINNMKHLLTNTTLPLSNTNPNLSNTKHHRNTTQDKHIYKIYQIRYLAIDDR
jgi:hypothetical protein